MRLIDEESLAALDGSRPADTLLVWAWRDGSLVVPEPLDVIEWSAKESAGESVKIGQTISLTVADPDGTLGAWKLDDPLGVNGVELQIIYRVGGAGAVNYGRFRITNNEPDERVESRVITELGLDTPDSELGPDKRRVFVTRAVVKLEAIDLTFGPDQDKFEAPQSPKAATVVTEFRRLTEWHFPTVVDPGVTDRSIPRTIVYDKERLEACQDLLARINTAYRMGGDGECHIYPTDSEPVWYVAPGKSMVKVSRKQSVDGLYNRWVVSGKDPGNGGKAVQAVISLDNGPLRYGGSHGRVPYFYTSDMIENDGDAVAYALKLRAEFLAKLAVDLVVTVPPRPELQAGDRVTVGCPVPAGHIVNIPGTITDISRGGKTVPDVSTLTVSCAYDDVVAALSRTDWAQDLTGVTTSGDAGGGLGLTWDQMPANWGDLPTTTWSDL